MTLQRFIFKNVLRNKRRTGLTVLSIGFSLFLLIALFTFLDILFNPPQTEEAALRLAVKRSTSLADQMPLAYGEKIRRVPHVRQVMPLQWFGGYYQDPKNIFATFAIDHQRLWEMFPELQVSPETKRAFANERIAAVAGVDLMKRYGWKVGDRITLQGNIFPVDLELHIVGEYRYELQENNLYFRYDYLNEALGDPGEVGSFWIKADRAESIPGIIEAVDGMFRNTAAETKTETEKAFILGFVAMIGNVKLMVGSITVVVVFTMLLVSGSTMAMAIRERTREVAILKAIGFQSQVILGLILGEAVFLSLLGVGVGDLLTMALRHADVYSMTQGFVPSFIPSGQTYLAALGIGLMIGLFSGLVPALQASRMTIIQAMRRLE